MVGCTTENKGDVAADATDGGNVTAADVVVAPDLQGQWSIVNIVENDSTYVRPDEIEPAASAYIDFKADSTFGIVTNCNHISGRFVQTGDSISFTDISFTELACDNMEIEDMMKKILPQVETVDCINDSITRLNCTVGESYIVLKRSSLK